MISCLTGPISRLVLPMRRSGRISPELAAMIQAGGFDVLAHPDVFRRVAWEVYGDVFEWSRWEDLIRSVWAACIERGIGVEINTASLRRGLDDPHPALEALRWYKAMGGERADSRQRCPPAGACGPWIGRWAGCCACGGVHAPLSL